MPSAKIDTTADADVVDAPPAGRFIRVHGYALTAAGAVEARLKDGAAAAYGGLASPAGGNAVALAHARDGYFDLPEGSKLQVTLSASVRVIGHVSYSVRQGSGAFGS